MLQDGFRFVRDREQWIVVPPGLAIAITALGFNLLGDALRAALDPAAGAVAAPARRSGDGRRTGPYDRRPRMTPP